MIKIFSSKFSYNKDTKTFKVKGGDVQFAMDYELVNLKTGKGMVFTLSHSTGSEWDPTTKWIYKSADKKFTLEVGNEEVTPAHAEAYAKSKGY